MPPSRPPATTITRTVYRATTYDRPLWANPNRRPGRWNEAGEHETQYYSLDAEAPFAEMLRGEDLRTDQEARTYKTILWQLEVDENLIVDYGTFEKADAAGFPADALVDDDHTRCRAEALRLRSLGFRGVLSPSAALPDSVSLTVFGPRVAIPWNAHKTLASMVPAQKLSEGSAPTGLVNRVRYYGDPHDALMVYQAAQKPLFRVPAQRRRPDGGAKP